MTYLLLTNVVSELRKRTGNRGVKTWIATQRTTELMLSVITVIEIEVGVMLRERHDRAEGQVLRSWFNDRVLTGFAGRILPLDVEVARRVAVPHVPDRAPRHDALIAGTARALDLTVVTRNVADFERTGAKFLNPWT